MAVTSVVRHLLCRQVLHFEEQPDLATLIEKWDLDEIEPETEIEARIDESEVVDCTDNEDAMPLEIPSMIRLKEENKRLRAALQRIATMVKPGDIDAELSDEMGEPTEVEDWTLDEAYTTGTTCIELARAALGEE